MIERIHPRSRRRRVPPLVPAAAPWTLFVLTLGACGALAPTDPLPPELQGWLVDAGTRPLPPAERRTATVRIESEALSGTFQAAIALRRAPMPAVRLQLFPELGGRVLDLAATPTTIEGRIPPAELALSWSSETSAPPRHLFSFLAVSLLEDCLPLDDERALGAAPTSGRGWRLALTPPMKGLAVEARFDGALRLLGKSYRLRKVSWEESVGEPRRFVGRDFLLEIADEEVHPAEDLPDSLFRLDP